MKTLLRASAAPGESVEGAQHKRMRQMRKMPEALAHALGVSANGIFKARWNITRAVSA